MWTLEEIGGPYEVTIVSAEDRASEEYRERHPLGMTEVEKRVFSWLFAKRNGEDLSEHAESFVPVGDALRDAVRDQPRLAGSRATCSPSPTFFARA
jgi:hypothetical protein